MKAETRHLSVDTPAAQFSDCDCGTAETLPE